MRTNSRVAAALVLVMTVCAIGGVNAGQNTITVTGTAKKEAKRPFTDNYVRARSVTDGSIAMAVPLDDKAGFVLAGLQPGDYLLELVNAEGKVVCTEGPHALTQTTTKNLSINCSRDRMPLYLLLAAAAAAGVTAGVVVNGPASPSR